jgi:hypothetical protein
LNDVGSVDAPLQTRIKAHFDHATQALAMTVEEFIENSRIASPGLLDHLNGIVNKMWPDSIHESKTARLVASETEKSPSLTSITQN